MPTPDGKIGARDLCAGAAVERVIADGGVSSLKISATLQSDNFSAGSAGWQINRVTGSAEFQDVVVRGTLNASDITSGTLNCSVVTVTNLSASSINTGTLAANYIGTGETGAITITIGTGGKIQSTDVDPDVVINGDGSAVFKNVTVTGTITAGAGSSLDWSYIQNVSVVNADITSLAANKIEAGSLDSDVINTGNLNANNINAGTLNVDRIASNSLTMGKIELAAALETNQYMQATTFSAGSAGWKIHADGSAEFNNVTVRGTVTASTITASTLTTAASGARVDISASTAGYIKLYSSTALAGSIYGTANDLLLSSPGDIRLLTSASDILTLTGGTSASLGAGQVTIQADTTDIELIAVGAGDQILLLVDTGTPGTDGTAAAPALSFTNDPDTGIFRAGADILGFSIGNTERFRSTTTDLYCNTASGSWALHHGTGSVSAASHTFQGDPNTGLYWITADYFAATAGGVIMQQWGKTGGGVKEIYMYGLAGEAQSSPDEYVLIDTGSGLLTYDTSTKDVKTNIRPLATSTEKFMALKPSLFDDIDGRKTDIAGFIAEEVAVTHPYLASWGYRQTTGPGEEQTEELRITNWNMRGMVAEAVAEVQKLIDRVEAIEERI